MAKKSPASVPPQAAIATLGTEPTKKSSRPLIFISHDHRDAPLAEAFANLLTDASGGFLRSFRSSDRKGGAGIEFGAQWYSEIMRKIDDATDVVALLTPSSLDRPWILYEAGVAKGKLDKPVFGVVVGVAFDQATKGPFAQFQNSADDEESLTKLVLQLIRRNSEAEPREEAVRQQVSAFRDNISKLVSPKPVETPSKPGDAEASDVAKLFEEIKVMFRDLPDRLMGRSHRGSALIRLQAQVTYIGFSHESITWKRPWRSWPQPRWEIKSSRPQPYNLAQLGAVVTE